MTPDDIAAIDIDGIRARLETDLDFCASMETALAWANRGERT